MEYIDIKKYIKQSSSPFLRKLPNFVIYLLKIIIKEKEINLILKNSQDTVGYSFLCKVIEDLNLTLDIKGKENLPEDGKCFFAANHPFGIIDGLIITHTVSEKYGKLNAIGNDAFMFIPQLRPFIFAVNVFGTNSRDSILALENLYNSDMPITHFPAGIVSRRINGKIQDSAWQKSFITKSISSKRSIVPIYFHGRNSWLFYAVSSFRKFLKIDLTLELILLPREIFLKKGKTLKVVIGKPIHYSTFDNTHSHLEWAQKVRSQVYAMGNNN